MYEEQPRYMGTLGLDKTFGRLNFWASMAAAGSIILTLIVGQSLDWSLGSYLLWGVPFISVSTSLMMEYHGVLVIRRVTILVTFYMMSMTRFRLFDARRLYATDVVVEVQSEPRLQRVDDNNTPLLGPALEDPV